jgi:hypothetical protein
MTQQRVVAWGEFAAAAPDIAARGGRLLSGGVAFIGTVTRDGAPRVAPFTPLICDDRLVALLGKHTVKYQCLLRDPRCSIHAVLGPDDEEFMMIGRAHISDDWSTRIRAAIEARKINMTSNNDVAFEFRIGFAHWAKWLGLGTPDIHRIHESWRSDREDA